MPWKFNSDTPIFMQIMDIIRLRIARGELKPGDKSPSVRELAIEVGVNPNTAQKALSELEREGVLKSERALGRFVAEVETDYKKSLCEQYNTEYVNKMRELGFDNQMIIKSLNDYLNSEVNTSEGGKVYG